MKIYRIKKARGFYRISKSRLYLTPQYTIMAQGSSIPRITSHVLTDFAALYRANKTFGVWRPRAGWYVQLQRYDNEEWQTVACFNNRRTAFASARWWFLESDIPSIAYRVIPGGHVK